MSRLVVLDVIRGVAIISVIGLHGIVSISGRLDNISPIFMQFFYFIAPLRMPVLMFLSGLFLFRSLKKGISIYFLGKIYRIVYPYVVWTFMMWVVFCLQCVFTNKEMNCLFFNMIFSPIEHLWFLHSLIMFFSISMLYFIPYGNIAYIIAATCIVLFVPDSFVFFKKDLFLLFSIGGVAGIYIDYLVRLTFRSILTICCIGFFVILFFQKKHFDLFFQVIFYLSIIPIVFSLCNLSMIINHTRYIQWIGRKSLEFYLSHLPLQMFLVQLFKFIDISGNSKIILNMILGFLLSNVFVLFCEKFGLIRKIFIDPR